MWDWGARYGVPALAVAVALITTLPHEPDVRFGFPAPLVEPGPEAVQGAVGPSFIRSTQTFDCSGLLCEAWLYSPRNLAADAAAPPVIVMAAGMGVQRDFGLPTIAEGLAVGGYAVWLFDYRTWGGSEGLPRHLVSANDHVADYMAAVAHIKATGGLEGRVDASRIVLWGSSFSGGHSLAAASQLGSEIRAVTIMEPFTSPWLLVRNALYSFFCPAAEAVPSEGKEAPAPPAPGILQQQAQRLQCLIIRPAASVLAGARLVLVALSDSLRALMGMPPAYVPLVVPQRALARHGWLLGQLWQPLALGVLADSDYDTMLAAAPPQPLGGWANLAAARMLWRYPTYRPLRAAARIGCPVLMVAGRHDLLTPEWSIRKAARAINLATGSNTASVVSLDGTHISLYRNPALVPTFLSFLDTCLAQ